MFETMLVPHIKCGIGCANMKVYVNLLVLFIMSVLSNAKYINVNENVPINVIKEDVQDSIQNLVRTGIYSHRHLDSSNVEIVTPIKVSREGSLVSHAVDHSHDHGHARARRDLTGREHKLEHSLHYNLTVGGRHLRLDLRPSVSFIIPAMIVERHSASGRTRDRPHPDSTGCHYTGSIRGQGSSTVALSACDGLAGLLRTEHGEYWIEPSNEIPTEESQGRPHVIFKRSAVSKEAAFYRSKRSIDNKDNKNNNLRKDWYNKETQRYSRHYNSRNYHGNRNVMDPRRREILENRAKRLELLRRNPYEYRKRLDEQKQSQSSSISNSVESSSLEELKKKNITKYSSEAERNRIIEKVSRWKIEERKRKMKLRKRRRRRTKNCGTKQPRYQWRKRNEKRESETISHRKNIEENKNLHRKIGEKNRRSARSISKPRHVEVLLVADKSMTEFHDKGNLEMYLLTIMNLVSSLYMDPTIGNYIKIVVVKIIIIDEDDPSSNLSVTPNADKTLSSFCRWQQRLNPEDDDNPHHHDVAILVTRQDICSQNDTPCSTLGVAHVAGMCKPDRSCSVNEDNGITLAHTITHELGHNFGLYHDTEKIGCNRRDGSTLHIMTPIFEADTAQVAWSRCSKRDVTNFLDSGMGECLGDAPSKKEYEYPSTPAGMIFDAATQCHLQFGSEAAVCAEPAELCEHLWCVVNNTCKTMLRPAAPGTVCGPDMWCQNQKCVGRTASPSPTDGGWGSWGTWSECSRSCGAGVSTQRRECDSPEPSHNGRYCIGERSRYKICNTDPCSITEPSFRDVQCSKFDNKPYRNKTFDKWVPYFDQDKPCELICVARDRPDEEQQDGFVADGTPCRQNLGSRDLCIAGVCHHVGCDWEVGSMMEEDACGVCGGDGSQCRTVQGLYTKGTTTQTGFSEVAIIPAGSRNVKIEEKVNPGNYIAIGSANKKKVYIRGARNITQTEYLVAGSPAVYERDRDWEKVRIPGPLTEDIKVYQRIYRGKRRNPGVTYQYTVERAAPAAPDSDRRWAPTAWGPCSVTCGAGTHARALTCRDRQQVEVDQSECYHLESPNIVLMRSCRLAACVVPSRSHPRPHALAHYRSTLQRQRQLQQARLTSATYWWFGAWNQCTHSCNVPGRPATRTRDVYCVDRVKNKVIDDSSCSHTRKPPRSIACNDLPPC